MAQILSFKEYVLNEGRRKPTTEKSAQEVEQNIDTVKSEIYSGKSFNPWVDLSNEDQVATINKLKVKLSMIKATLDSLVSQALNGPNKDANVVVTEKANVPVSLFTSGLNNKMDKLNSVDSTAKDIAELNQLYKDLNNIFIPLKQKQTIIAQLDELKAKLNSKKNKSDALDQVVKASEEQPQKETKDNEEGAVNFGENENMNEGLIGDVFSAVKANRIDRQLFNTKSQFSKNNIMNTLANGVKGKETFSQGAQNYYTNRVTKIININRPRIIALIDKANSELERLANYNVSARNFSSYIRKPQEDIANAWALILTTRDECNTVIKEAEKASNKTSSTVANQLNNLKKEVYSYKVARAENKITKAQDTIDNLKDKFNELKTTASQKKEDRQEEARQAKDRKLAEKRGTYQEIVKNEKKFAKDLIEVRLPELTSSQFKTMLKKLANEDSVKSEYDKLEKSTKIRTALGPNHVAEVANFMLKAIEDDNSLNKTEDFMKEVDKKIDNEYAPAKQIKSNALKTLFGYKKKENKPEEVKAEVEPEVKQVKQAAKDFETEKKPKSIFDYALQKAKHYNQD